MNAFKNLFQSLKARPTPATRSLPRTKRTLGEVLQNPSNKDREIYGEINKRMLRMYDAAVTNNLNLDFPISITSENAEIFTSIIASRGRARRVVRDNPFARSIVESHIDNVGGDDPFRLEMKVGKKGANGQFVEERETNEEIEAWWKEAGEPENCCANGMYSRAEMDWQAIACIVRDGGVVYRHHEFFPDNEFGYAIEPIEIDRLDHYYNRPSNGKNNEIQFSIELNSYKRPVAYWILDRHPGDVFAFANTTRYRTQYPAKDIIALFDIRTRAGQLVGMPRIAASIQRLHRIDQFDIAHCTAAIWTACKPIFFTQEFPNAMELVPDFIRGAIDRAQQIANEGEGFGGGENQKFNNMDPGSAEVLPFGYKPHQMDAKFPVESAQGFTKDNLRAVGASVSMPYHALTGDYSEINFSSGRLGENAWHDTCKRLQHHLIVNYRVPHFRRALYFALLTGKVNLPVSRWKEFCKAATFYGRRWPYLQPVQDAQADLLRLESKTDSPSHIIGESERGGKAEDVYSEWASDIEAAKKHGLDITGDSVLPVVKKGDPLQTENPPDDNPPPKGKKSAIFCLECHARARNGETVCRECGSDSIAVYRQALELTHARR